MRNATLALLLLCTLSAAAGAQETPLAAPARNGIFEALLSQAEALTREENWSAARRAWEQVVRENPHVGRYWYALATASLNAGDREAAINALERYVDVGGAAPGERSVFGPNSLAGAAYDIARLHAMQGRRDPAFSWLERTLKLGFRDRGRIASDSAFIALRSDQRFQSLVPPVVVGLSRDAGWRADIAYLAQECERLHPAPHRRYSKAAFDSAVQALQASVGQLSDNAIAISIQRLLSRIGDGHTTIVPDGYAPWQRTLPLQFESYEGGVHIIAADSRYARLVGKRVRRFGKRSIEEISRSLDEVASLDNAIGVLRLRNRNLRYLQMLSGLGLIPESDSVQITVEERGGRTRTMMVVATPTPEGYNRLTGHPAWVTARASTPGPDPLYLRDRITPYWFVHMPERRMVYFAFNLVVDTPAESFEQFATRLFRFADSTSTDYMVIDLRWNNGGNSRLLPPLLQGIIPRDRINRPGHLFVLTSRYTYSAAMNAATFLERHTNATFVGEPTPSSPNFVGESNIIALPYSSLRVSISDVFWQSSWPFDERAWIAPAYYVPLTLEAYRGTKDPALEVIMNVIRGAPEDSP